MVTWRESLGILSPGTRDAHNYYAWTMLETLPLIMGTKGYRLLLLASANHITLKGTQVTGYTIVYSRLGRTIIRVII